MKMEAITQETRLLCRCHIDTTEQLCDYKSSLQSEITELTEQRKGLYSQSRKAGGEKRSGSSSQCRCGNRKSRCGGRQGQECGVRGEKKGMPDVL